MTDKEAGDEISDLKQGDIVCHHDHPIFDCRFVLSVFQIRIVKNFHPHGDFGVNYKVADYLCIDKNGAILHASICQPQLVNETVSIIKGN